MIPTIGLMIGVYTITRLTSFITRKGDREEATLVKIFAAIALVITVICIFSLLISGAEVPPTPRLPY